MRITAPVTDYIRESVLTTEGDLAVRGAALVERLASGIAGTYFQGKGAATKPAYEKTMPPLTTQGDLIVQGAALPERLAGGGAGFYLQSQGAGAIPIYKQTMPPLTTHGDLIAQGAAIPVRIPIQLSGKVLASFGAGAAPYYASLFNLLTTQGDLWVRGATWAERIAAGALDTYFKGQGAATLPIYEKLALRDTGVFIGVGTRNAAGDQVITGVGFRPSAIVIIACDDTVSNLNSSFGFDNGTLSAVFYRYDGGSLEKTYATRSVYLRRDVDNRMEAYVSALGADGFTITWALTGACVLDFVYLCLP